MDTTIYRATVARQFDSVDMDMCPVSEDETVFDDLFISRDSAVSAAQSKFEQTPLNDCVHQVWAVVRPVAVTTEGAKIGGAIYRNMKINN